MKPNILKTEPEAIKSLQNDKSIIIKEADKGGATVIMDKEHYKQMVQTIINDSSYNVKLAANHHKETSLKYNKFLNKYQNQFTEKELDYLRTFEIKSSQFYGLPKIHKNERININVNCQIHLT